MKVVNLCVDDWANFSYDMSQAMRVVGIDAYSYKLNKHHHNYTQQSEVCGWDKMFKECKDADVVNVVHSNELLFSRVRPYIKGKVNVVYTGTVYRKDPDKYNAIFNPHVNKSIIALGEFAGLGAKNAVYMVGAIDTGKIVPNYRDVKHPYVISHYPSNSNVKGSDKINKMMKEVKGKDRLYFYNYSDISVASKLQYVRMNECDIYLELFSPLNNGKKYGSFGITALEAAAMGKIVVTQNLSAEVYKNNYGDCALQCVEDESEFILRLTQLTIAPSSRIKQLQEETRQWVVDKHSYKATGEYILKNILQ